jgi:hypothetical protein
LELRVSAIPDTFTRSKRLVPQTGRRTMRDEKKKTIDFLNQREPAEFSTERANNMNTIPTIGLPMWRVSMIAWKRRSGKRLNRLISRAHRLSMRLFISQRLQGRC